MFNVPFQHKYGYIKRIIRFTNVGHNMKVTITLTEHTLCNNKLHVMLKMVNTDQWKSCE